VCAVAALAGAVATAGAQDLARPWLEWRTISTANYRFHFRAEFEPWTRQVADRVESVDSALGRAIGYRAPSPIHVVVDDPYSIANGYAIPYVDKPATVWWTTPPDPRDQIGNFRTFGEILAVHELAHLAHLTRPSRNPARRMFDLTFLNLGPIATKAPRWVHEGYATVIEGQLTGTGRPNNAHRAALLRQWAIEGRLPSYDALNGSGSYFGGSFPYLGGSAFLEWLSARHGDSSLVHVWRRLTARRTRSFDAAFAGVFGEPPGLLYGRHVAELTRDAMAAKAALDAAGLREGQLVQHRTWDTGDPAISPDGSRVVVNLWAPNRSGRLVIWKTTPEPEDSAALKKEAAALKRDPQDVAERRVYPRGKKALKTLAARNGRSFMMPRWFADNKRVLVTRWTVRGDGSQSPALYVWDTDRGDVRQVTEPVGVSNGDPHPNAKDAVAMQCRWGHCDLAQVDLERGTVVTLLEGNTRTTYHRPRYSPDGTRIVTGVAQDGRWRVAVADARGRELRYVDPDDGANRYEAQWLGNDSLVVVSELGGISNLEVVDIRARAVRALTRVTGAAFAPDVNPRDRSIWFLSLHSRGLDVRRLATDAPIADSVVPVTAEQYGMAGTRGVRPTVRFATGPVSETRDYGAGPRRYRLVPGSYGSSDGAGSMISLYGADVVGRLSAIATGALGAAGNTTGGSVRAAWRYPRPAIEFGAIAFIHEPSRGPSAQPGVDTLDLSLFQGLLGANAERRGDGWHARARVGGAAGRLSPRYDGTHLRALGFGELSLAVQRSRGARSLGARGRVHFTHGNTRTAFERSVAALDLAVSGFGVPALQGGVTAGRLTGHPHQFEEFVVGGVPSPVGDSSLLSQRYGMPMFPTGIARGTAVFGWRVAMPLPVLTAFYEGASTSADVTHFTKWNRAAGLEERFSIGPFPTILVPRTQIRAGAGYTLDEPFRKKVRGFVELRVEP
jgi:Tol biopolymer transport system component